MFVIELVYKADLREIDAHMRAHVRFLKKYYAAGNFLVSGRKIPREGGIILAVGKSDEVSTFPDTGRDRGSGRCRASALEFEMDDLRGGDRADEPQSVKVIARLFEKPFPRAE